MPILSESGKELRSRGFHPHPNPPPEGEGIFAQPRKSYQYSQDYRINRIGCRQSLFPNTLRSRRGAPCGRPHCCESSVIGPPKNAGRPQGAPLHKMRKSCWGFTGLGFVSETPKSNESQFRHRFTILMGGRRDIFPWAAALAGADSVMFVGLFDSPSPLRERPFGKLRRGEGEIAGISAIRQAHGEPVEPRPHPNPPPEGEGTITRPWGGLDDG